VLGRKSYTRAEVNSCRAALDQALAAHAALTEAVAAATPADKVAAALEELDGVLFNDLLLVLDRWFVHRLRGVTGKHGTPLNEVELISDSLRDNGGIFRGSTVITYVPEQAVVGLRPGDRIRLTREDFERLAAGTFAELEEKYL
jgi:hypothetical protein